MNYPPQNSPNNVKTLLPDILKTPIGQLSANLDGLIDRKTYEVMVTLLEKDLSENSKKAFVSDFTHFTRWFCEKNREVLTPKRLTEYDIANYRDEYKKAGKAESTINRRLMSLKSFCKVAIKKGFMHENVAEDVKMLKQQVLAPRKLNPSELRKFLREVSIRGNLRDKLIIEMLVGAGFRASELANLKVVDIKMTERKTLATIHHGKGNKKRIVPLNKNIKKLLEEYLAQYQPKDFLLVGQRGPIQALAIHHIVSVYAKKAGVKAWPHLLRHHFAYNYLSNHPDDVVGVAQLLGHSNLNTTFGYVRHSEDNLQEKVDAMVY